MGNRLNGTSGRTDTYHRGTERPTSDQTCRQTHRNGAGDNNNGSSRGKRKRKGEGINSCPDLVRSQTSTSGQQWVPSGLSPRERDGPPLKCEYKIYRSYSDLNDSKRSSYADLPPVEVKVYRRSTERLTGSVISTNGGLLIGKAQSLPRGIERLTGGVGPGSLAASQDLSTAYYYPSHPPSSCSGGSGGGTDVTSRQTSRRTSARSSLASVSACKVSPEDFPSTQNIRRKLSEFEAYFSHSLLETFQCLPPLNQLSCLSLATRPDRANQSVSLLQYLESESIPADLHLPLSSVDKTPQRREYFLTVPVTLFERAKQIRTEGQGVTGSGTDKDRLELARDIAGEISREAAGELSRMFEYQISLIQESVALRMLAKYAVDCVYDVMKRRQRLLDRNTVVQGAVKGRPRDSSIGSGRKLISVIVGAKELKWNIFDIFKRPGLRRDLYPAQRVSHQQHSTPANGELIWESRDELRSPSVYSVGSRDELRGGDMAWAWRYYTAAHGVEPMLYGYRGQMVEWDYVNEHYRLNSEDETTYCEEISPRYDDFHRLYCPYMWLIGLETVQDYIQVTREQQNYNSQYNQSTTNSDAATSQVPTLVQYVKHLRNAGGSQFIRDDIKLVFRPLKSAQTGGVDGTSARLWSMELEGKALVGNTASEVSKACDELRCRLDNLNGGGKESGKAGAVRIQVICPDGQRLSSPSSDCGMDGLVISDI